MSKIFLFWKGRRKIVRHFLGLIDRPASFSQTCSVFWRKKQLFISEWFFKNWQKFLLSQKDLKKLNRPQLLLKLRETLSFFVFWSLSSFYKASNYKFTTIFSSVAPYRSVNSTFKECRETQLEFNFLDVATLFSPKLQNSFFSTGFNRKRFSSKKSLHWKVIGCVSCVRILIEQ